MIYLGADHGGYRLKESLKKRFAAERIRFVDCGAFTLNNRDDYPKFARAVAQAVAKNPRHRGIVLCRSGVGVGIVANKTRGVRSVVATDVWLAKRSRRDDNTNVIALPAERITGRKAWAIVSAWLDTKYRATARDVRRLKQIARIDHAAR